MEEPGRGRVVVGDLAGSVVLLPRLFDRAEVHLPALVAALALGAVGLLALTADAVGPTASPLEAAAIIAVGALVAARRRRRLAVAVAVTVVGLAVATLLTDIGPREPDSTRYAMALGVVAGTAGLAVIGRALLERRAGRPARGAEVGVVLLGLGALGLGTPEQALFLLQQVAAFTLLVAAGAMLVRAGGGPDPSASTGKWFRDQAQSWEDRAELVDRLSFEGADERTRLARFLALMAFASVLASLGVIVDSTAIVIGAMLVAPLMTPLMAASLSLAVGWSRRAARAGLVAVGGALLAVAIGMVVGAAMPLPLGLASNPQVLSRTAPSLIDLAVALAAGGAGAFALARRDVADALPGVAIAISLVPPLTVVGITLQAGELVLAAGATLLFATNVTSILVAGAAVFVLTGVVPARRLGDPAARRTLRMAVVVVFVPILVGLIVSGQRIVVADTEQVRARATTVAWLEEDSPGLRLDGVEVQGLLVVVEVTGTEAELPDVDGLAGALSETLGRSVAVRLEVTPRLIVQSGIGARGGDG